MLQMIEPSRLVELNILVADVRHRLRLFEDRGIDAKIVSAQEAEHVIANDLTVLGGVKSIPKVHPTARQITAQMRKLFPYLAVVKHNGCQNEVLRPLKAKIKVPSLIHKYIAQRHSGEPTRVNQAGETLTIMVVQLVP